MKHFKHTSTILILFFAVMFVVCGFKTVNAEMAENNLSAVDDYVKVGIDAKLYRGLLFSSPIMAK